MNKNQSMLALQNALADPAFSAVLENAFPIWRQELVVAAASDATNASLPAEPSAFDVLVGDAVMKSLSGEKFALRLEEVTARAVTAHTEELDFADAAEDAIKDAMRDFDLSSEAEDALREAIDGGSRQIERALESAIEETMSNFDLEPMVKDAVDQYVASVMDEAMAGTVIAAEIALQVAKAMKEYEEKATFKMVRVVCENTLVLPANVVAEERVTE